MEGKKSFVLYADLIHTVRKMPKEKQAELFMLILEYVNDLNPNVENDLVLSLVFEPIKHQLKRDLIKWEKRCEVNAKNGALGGRPKKEDEVVTLPPTPPEPPKAGKEKKPKVAITPEESEDLIESKEVYDQFIRERSGGVGAKFDGQQINALKSIMAYVKSQQKDKEGKVSDSLKHIFQSWEKLDPFTKSKTTLSQINQNIQNIIITLKNPQVNGKQVNSKQFSNDRTDEAIRKFAD